MNCSAQTWTPWDAEFQPGLPGIASATLELGEPERALAELLVSQQLPAELSKAVPKRRAEFLAGRRAAALALARLGRSGEVGREVDGRPVWPAGVVGSITHGAGLAAAAVADSETHLGIGIDVESLIEGERARSIAEKIADETELRTILGGMSAARNPDLALSLAFSVKESLFKCTHPSTSEFLGFHEVRLLGFRSTSAWSAECVLDVLRPESRSWVSTGRLSARVAWSEDRVSSLVALTRVAKGLRLS